jgi:hypothetical protein
LFAFFLSLQALRSQPTITSFTPLSAKPGDVVTLTGTGFNATPANNIVFFGAAKATVSTASTTSLSVTVPVSATYAPISVLNTATVLAANSLANFNPIFAPAKTTITTSDFSPKEDFASGTGPIFVKFGDLDNDGKPEMVIVNNTSNTISVFKNTSTLGSIASSSFATKVDFTTGTAPFSVAIGDLDGDGKPDLAVANLNSNTVSVFHNASTSGSITSGSFAAKVDFTTGSSPSSVAIGDLDGDGKLDLATVNRSSTSVSVFRNTSTSGSITTGSFAAKVDFTTGAFPNAVSISDLDGDGKLDLAVANFNSSSLSIFHNTSTSGSITTGSFAAKVDFTTGNQPYLVSIGDLDGDGKPDLAVANNGSNYVSVFHNTSTSGSITTGSFAAKVDFTTGTNPRTVDIGDLDGDGKPDLAVACAGSDAVSVFRNTSTSGSITTGSFAAKVDFTTGIDPNSVAICDIDGDGKPDLAAPNYGSNNVSVLRNAEAPTVISFTPLSGPVGTSVTITGTNFNAVTAVSFNGVNASYTVNSITSITATVPPTSTTGAISVVNALGTGTSGTNFTVTPPPTITSFSPSSGIVGTTIVISGTNFTGASEVLINTTPVTSFIVDSASQITAVVASGTTSGKVYVTTPSGTDSSITVFTIIADLIVSTNTTVSGTYNNITITGTGVAALSGTLNALGNTTIQTGGAINFGTQILSGSGTFTAQSGSRLVVGSPQGIDSVGTLGNIQVNGTRTINSGALVEYNAASGDQNTGNLISTIDTIIVNIASGDLILNNSLTVNNRLDLTLGSVRIGTNDLTIGASGSIANANTSNYIKTNGIGTLRKTVQNNSTNVLYPVGTTASYNPAQVQLNGTSTTDVISVRVFDGVLSAATSGTPIASSMVNRTWVINENVIGGSNATITLQWNGTEEVGSFNRNISAISRYNTPTNQWTYVGATFGAAVGSNPYTRTLAGIASLSAFTVGDDVANSLPVSLISFNAKALNNDVLLSWSTASEQNNKGFAIERSTDGENFAEVDFVNGNKFSSVRVHYKSLDQKAFDAGNTLYYRLRQVDFDGITSYSNVVSVTKSNMPAAILNVYPNPFTQGLLLEIVSLQNEVYNVIVTDLQGRTVATRDVLAVKGLNSISMTEMDELKAGIYFVKLIGQETITLKVVKAN